MHGREQEKDGETTMLQKKPVEKTVSKWKWSVGISLRNKVK